MSRGYALAALVVLAALAGAAPLAVLGQTDLDVQGAVVLRSADVNLTISAATAANLSFTAPNVAVVDDLNETDGLRPVLDFSLVPQIEGPVIVRVFNVTNNANISIGDTSASIQATSAVVWYEPGTGVRVWVPGQDYLTVQTAYVIPDAEADYAVAFERYVALSGSPQGIQYTIEGYAGKLAKTIHLNAGDKVYVEVVSDSGSHDVYIFKPSNTKKTLAESATTTSWMYYAYTLGADYKIWYPMKSTSFTAPESGDYLFVVVPYKTPGNVKVVVTVQSTAATTTTQPPASSTTSDSGSIEGVIGKLQGVIGGQSSSLAVIIIVIAVALAAVILARK